MATSWKNVRAAKTMRKGDMILGLSDGNTDAEIWEKFNAEINADVVSDYMAEFCGVLTETKTPMRLSLVTNYLPTIFPNRKQELLHFAIIICSNHNDAEGTAEYIDLYKKTYGEDKEILLEELNYYNTFDTENVVKIAELVKAIKNYSEV